MSLITINKRLTRHQKEKNNFQEMRDKMDSFDLYTGQYRDDRRLKNLQVNYGLFNGKLDVSLYDDPVAFKIGGEEVTFDYQSVSHYPLISQIANAIVGEQEERPFNPMVKSNTHERNTVASIEFNKDIKRFLDQKVVQPKRQSILQELAIKYGVQDLFSLGIEEQQQLMSEVEGRVQAETPEEIIDFYSNDFTTPLEKQAQRLLDFIVEYHDVWYQQIMGFKHAVITGEEYYYTGVRDEELVFECVPPMYFQWGGSQRTEWVQQGSWAKLESWYTEEDIIQRHFKELSTKDIKDLSYYSEPIGGVGYQQFYDWDNNTSQKMFMENIARNPELRERYKSINIKTQKGQAEYRNIVTDVFGKNRNNSPLNGYDGYGIRESHIVWRDKRILKRVTRIDNGKKVKFWVDEHYTPTESDIEVTKHWVDEVWEGYKLGTFDNKYVGLRPVPYQYKSLDNPNNVDLPYVGKRYNTHDNVERNVSMIDVGKTLQKDFDLTMASIKHDLNTNIGQGYIIYMNMIPEGVKWQDWLDVLRNSGLMIADPHKKGINNIDAGFLKQFNISKLADVSNKIQLAEYFRTALARTMYFNETRLGQIGQYTNKQNAAANEVASYKQTALFFTQHNKVLEKALSSILNVSRFYYKDNPEKAAKFLDDVSLAELISGPRTSYRELMITVNNSVKDIRKMQMLKQQTLSFIQNPSSIVEGIIDLTLADTESEIRDIVKRETLKFEKRRKEELEAQQQMQQQKSAAELEKEKMKQDREDLRLKEKLISQERRTELDSQKFLMANDVNKNQLNDLFEAKMAELNTKMAIEDKKLAIEREKMELQQKLASRRK